MPKNTKKASDRIFYTAPRNWKVWHWIFTPGALVLFLLSSLLSLMLYEVFK